MAHNIFEFSRVWGPEGLLLCLRLTVTVYVLHLVYADRTSVCLHTHTRVRAQGLMSSSQCTLDFCVSRLGYPILLDDRRRQESYFLYNLREQRGAAKVWSGLNFSASKVTLTLAECEEMISCSSFASCFIVINISPHLISCFLLPSCLLNLLLLVW